MRAAILISFCIANTAYATDDYAALLAEASRSLDSFDGSHWVFTETIESSEGTFVGRHDGRLDENQRWTLLSVDDREPTDEERDEYLSEKRKDDDDDDGSIADMVNVGSMNLKDETESRWLFEFSPIGDDEDDSDFLEHVEGEIEISKNLRHISSIRLQSDKPFKPHFTVKISEFLTHLRFGSVANHSQIVPLQIKVKIKARALLVKGVEEESVITYSDYEFVGNQDGE